MAGRELDTVGAAAWLRGEPGQRGLRQLRREGSPSSALG